MKKWFRFVWEYPNGKDMHHNVFIAWQACLSIVCLVRMEQPDLPATECRIYWWLGLLAIINGLLLVIHNEFFVKPDYWKPKDKKK